MSWLGVYFDHRLSFADLSGKIASQGRKVVSGLSILVNTTKEIEAVIMRKTVHVCILPILKYDAPAW